jgi:hypothetical protein
MKQFYHVEKWNKIWATFVVFRRAAQSKQSPNRRKFDQSDHPDQMSLLKITQNVALPVHISPKLINKF